MERACPRVTMVLSLRRLPRRHPVAPVPPVRRHPQAVPSLPLQRRRGPSPPAARGGRPALRGSQALLAASAAWRGWTPPPGPPPPPPPPPLCARRQGPQRAASPPRGRYWTPELHPPAAPLSRKLLWRRRLAADGARRPALLGAAPGASPQSSGWRAASRSGPAWRQQSAAAALHHQREGCGPPERPYAAPAVPPGGCHLAGRSPPAPGGCLLGGPQRALQPQAPQPAELAAPPDRSRAAAQSPPGRWPPPQPPASAECAARPRGAEGSA